MVGGTTPAHQPGRLWVDTGTANMLIVKQSDGADWTELWRVDTAANTFLHQSDVTVASAYAGAGAGPTLTLNRASASPAAADQLGALSFQGRSSTGVARSYAKLLADILDATNASEDGRLLFQTAVAGTLATRMTLRDRLLLAVALETAKGASVASAATTDIWSAGDGTLLHVTGTTTITSLGTAPQAGALRVLIFDAALTLTHGANLILNNNGSNIVTAAGDIGIVFGDTMTKHYCYVLRATGNSVTVGSWAFSSGAMAIGTGTTKDVTGINAAGEVNEIIIFFEAVSHNAANTAIAIQLGDSGGIETSGYSGAGISNGTGTAYTTNSASWRLSEDTQFDAAQTYTGTARLTHVGSNVWTITALGTDAAALVYYATGSKTLTAPLSQLRITTPGGTATFDAGIFYVVAR